MQETKSVDGFDWKKKTNENGSFEGLLSSYGNVDLGKDRVLPGAFSKNLKDRGTRRPLLWSHDTKTPIGMLDLDDRPDGLWAKGQLLLTIPQAQTTYELIKAGVVTGLSIGYDAIRKQFKDGVRELQEIVLWEGSAVVLPMDELARITGVKTHNFNNPETIAALRDFKQQVLGALSKGLK